LWEVVGCGIWVTKPQTPRTAACVIRLVSKLEQREWAGPRRTACVYINDVISGVSRDAELRFSRLVAKLILSPVGRSDVRSTVSGRKGCWLPGDGWLGFPDLREGMESSGVERSVTCWYPAALLHGSKGHAPTPCIPTLNRLFIMHFILPFIIALMVILHLIFLHRTGSKNLTTPPNSVIGHLRWKCSDYVLVICQQLHIWTYNRQNLSGDLWSPSWRNQNRPWQAGRKAWEWGVYRSTWRMISFFVLFIIVGENQSPMLSNFAQLIVH